MGWLPLIWRVAPPGRARVPLVRSVNGVRRSTPSLNDQVSSSVVRAGTGTQPRARRRARIGSPSSSASRPIVAPRGDIEIVLSVMNFGKPQMERPASSVNAWFTGSWRMSVPIRSPTGRGQREHELVVGAEVAVQVLDHPTAARARPGIGP